jgi:uncharacterized heparinase superfamily protein
MTRAADSARDAADALRVSLGWRPRPPAALLSDPPPRFRVCDLAVGEWASAAAGSPEAAWRDRLVGVADEVLAHRLTLFDLDPCDLGADIDWNADPKSGRRAPLRFGRWVDYRDYATAGDCKFVWEPNRHQHLVVLARAYRATGDLRYARAVEEHLSSWLDHCPFARGMNWRSTLELGIRLINWVWTLDLIRESGSPGPVLRRRILESVYQQVWEIARRYSSGSSANNHLIGEAAGAFVATAYFSALDPDGRLHRESREILVREIGRQSHADGGSREQAVGYQVFVLQFYLVVDKVAEATGAPMPPSFRDRLERMADFLGVLAEGGDCLPSFGDADDGYVLDLGGRAEDWRSWLGVAAVRFGRGELALQADGHAEATRWLLGRQGPQALQALARHPEGPLVPRALPESGYYLLQTGSRAAGDGVSVVFDCGELGFSSIAAHGHADALSFTLRAFGQDVLVDPGTYDYFTYPEWRRYFRSTRAHNTVTVDGLDQSTMEGPFLWGQRANARCVAFDPAAEGGRVTGEHDGYGRLPDPVVHRRTLALEGGPAPVLTITDEIRAAAPHEVAVYFHLSETATLVQSQTRSVDVRFAAGSARLRLDEALEVEILEGSHDPRGGWVSRGYHRRSPSATVAGRIRGQGPLILVCRVELRRGPAGRA